MASVVNLASTASLSENSSECVEMFNVADAASGPEGLSRQVSNNDYARYSATIEEILQNAADNGGKSFNIFLKSTEFKNLPRRDPRATQLK